MKSKYILLLITLMFFCNCNSKPQNNLRSMIETHKAEGYGKVLPDSISGIVLNAKEITCELKSKNPEDTVRVDSLAKVPKWLLPTVKILFLNEQNFQSDDTVFGTFNPWVCYVFKAPKNKSVLLEMDFGLRKWRLSDSEGKHVYGADMKELNQQFLSLTRLMFPDDITLKMLNDNLNLIKTL